MADDKKTKPGVAFWATVVVVVLLVLYPLSIGPTRWLRLHDLMPEWASKPVHSFYAPFRAVYHRSPDAIIRAVDWYYDLWNAAQPPRSASAHR
jgi:hypothetical protein